ncbi:MAG: hypothetical protein EA350_03810 [Gemmatimonadales bacterium]|nr:MAG: hypothetical protein EA350_03810 [Gemmatimonadales bacterium]
MALNPGNPGATTGMARDIYLMIDATLRPPLEEDLSEEAIEEMQESWRALSFAIAQGVVSHLRREPPHQAEYAEAFSSGSQDSAYWAWLSDFATLFRDWASDGGTLADLRDRINTHAGARDVPTQIRGVLQ